MSEEDDKKYTSVGVWLAVGAGIGVAIGAAMSLTKAEQDGD